MEFISTKGMTNDTAPEGKVLVQYLEPFFGEWSVDFAIGYYDNPNNYEGGTGDGWKHWDTENKINVIAYAVLPEPIKTELTELTQREFIEKLGSYRPNLGSIGS